MFLCQYFYMSVHVQTSETQNTLLSRQSPDMISQKKSFEACKHESCWEISFVFHVKLLTQSQADQLLKNAVPELTGLSTMTTPYTFYSQVNLRNAN